MYAVMLVRLKVRKCLTDFNLSFGVKLRGELFFGQFWSNVTLYLERFCLKIYHFKKKKVRITSLNQVGI